MIAQAPGMKPPYIEGDFFTSSDDGVASFKLGKRIVRAADLESFEIEFTHDESSGTSRWTDRAQMRREDGRWKLDDVEYGGDRNDAPNFAVRGRLSDTLKQTE